MKPIGINMKRPWLFLMLAVNILASCTQREEERAFGLPGVWVLQELQLPDGHAYSYPQEGMTWMRIYDDSCYYQCQLATAPTGTMITPSGMNTYTCIERGEHDVLYLQGNDTHPLTIIDDSTMVIQETGRRYTRWLSQDYEEGRSREIVNIICHEAENANAAPHRYVFSQAEKRLTTVNYTLTYILIFVVVAFMIFLNRMILLYKDKKRVEQELLRIEQEQKALPEPVRQALDNVESDFHQSDYYLSLRRRIASGERLKKGDWDELEQHLGSVYPGFTNRLMSLTRMSQVEYQVSLLIKLNATPSEIANVLCKDVSSISTTRSRLYQKVFGKKGGSKEWDEFIYSL